MEVVINRQYGGFGLSIKAQKYYLALIGKEMFLYHIEKWRHEEGGPKYVKVSESDTKKYFCLMVLTKDLGEETNDLPDEFFFIDSDIERSDPNLIKTVRDLGLDANGDYAELKIVNIPDGTKYVIHEYDGMESVEEAHNSWS